MKIWCLPNLSEGELNALHQLIVRATISIRALGISGEEDMLVLFPPDKMSYGLGTEILIEIGGFPTSNRIGLKPELCARLGAAIKDRFPDANVTSQTLDGRHHWDSRKNN